MSIIHPLINWPFPFYALLATCDVTRGTDSELILSYDFQSATVIIVTLLEASLLMWNWCHEEITSIFPDIDDEVLTKQTMFIDGCRPQKLIY